MELVVSPDGQIRCIYAEAIDLAVLGKRHVVRASHVEPDELGLWWIDLSPVDGPRIGPFNWRSDALQVEREWLMRYRLS